MVKEAHKIIFNEENMKFLKVAFLAGAIMGVGVHFVAMATTYCQICTEVGSVTKCTKIKCPLRPEAES